MSVTSLHSALELTAARELRAAMQGRIVYLCGYPNMLGPDDPEQNAQAYGTNVGGQRAGRLQRVKRLFDAEGVFTGHIPSTSKGCLRAPLL